MYNTTGTMSWADGGDPAEIRGRGHRLGHISHGQNGHMPLETLLDCGFLNLDLQKKKNLHDFLQRNRKLFLSVCLSGPGGTRVTRWGRRKKKKSFDDVTPQEVETFDRHPRVVVYGVQGADVLPPPPHAELRWTMTSSDGEGR